MRRRFVWTSLAAIAAAAALLVTSAQRRDPYRSLLDKHEKIDRGLLGAKGNGFQVTWIHAPLDVIRSELHHLPTEGSSETFPGVDHEQYTNHDSDEAWLLWDGKCTFSQPPELVRLSQSSPGTWCTLLYHPGESALVKLFRRR